jgi:hypothetical protein
MLLAKSWLKFFDPGEGVDVYVPSPTGRAVVRPPDLALRALEPSLLSTKFRTLPSARGSGWSWWDGRDWAPVEGPRRHLSERPDARPRMAWVVLSACDVRVTRKPVEVAAPDAAGGGDDPFSELRRPASPGPQPNADAQKGAAPPGAITLDDLESSRSDAAPTLLATLRDSGVESVAIHLVFTTRDRLDSRPLVVAHVGHPDAIRQVREAVLVGLHKASDLFAQSDTADRSPAQLVGAVLAQGGTPPAPGSPVLVIVPGGTAIRFDPEADGGGVLAIRVLRGFAAQGAAGRAKALKFLSDAFKP